MTNQTLNQNQEIGVLTMTNQNQEMPVMTEKQAFSHLTNLATLDTVLYHKIQELKHIVNRKQANTQKLLDLQLALIELERYADMQFARLIDTIEPFCNKQDVEMGILNDEFYKTY